jgi:hypothetical protein
MKWTRQDIISISLVMAILFTGLLGSSTAIYLEYKRDKEKDELIEYLKAEKHERERQMGIIQELAKTEDNGYENYQQ